MGRPISPVFLSTLPARGATAEGDEIPFTKIFLSTLPARGATPTTSVTSLSIPAFLSTLPARGATGLFQRLYCCLCDFYPRSPRGERPDGTSKGCPQRYFYPRSPRGERPAHGGKSVAFPAISIHAPREGSDKAQWAIPSRRANFYPRSPRGEPRLSSPASMNTKAAFLSTLPARGATTHGAVT